MNNYCFSVTLGPRQQQSVASVLYVSSQQLISKVNFHMKSVNTQTADTV